MTAVLAIFIATLSIGAGFLRGYHAAPDARRSRTGWYALGLMVMLIAGMLVSAQAGLELAVYGFGFAMALVLPVMVVIGVASAVGRAVRRRKDAQR